VGTVIVPCRRIILIYLSFMLFQRKRLAWWLAALSACALVVARFLEGHAWYAMIAPTVTLILLILSRKLFTTRSEPSSVKRGIILMAVSLLIALVYGTSDSGSCINQTSA